MMKLTVRGIFWLRRRPAPSILRRGKLVGGGEVSQLTANDISSLMMGGQREPRLVPKVAREPGIVVLELDRLCADKESGVPAGHCPASKMAAVAHRCARLH